MTFYQIGLHEICSTIFNPLNWFLWFNLIMTRIAYGIINPQTFTNDYDCHFLQCSVIQRNCGSHHSHTFFICVLISKLPKHSDSCKVLFKYVPYKVGPQIYTIVFQQTYTMI